MNIFVVLNKDIIINISCDLINKKSKERIRHCLLYEYKLGCNASEAARNIYRVIGKGAVSTATEFRWFERFSEQGLFVRR